jgi:hypothetical protein
MVLDDMLDDLAFQWKKTIRERWRWEKK